VLFAGPLLVVHAVTNAHTPGLGDVKIAASAGLVCGAFDVQLAIPALVLSCLVGGVFGMSWQRRTGERAFPLAPAIATGTAIALALGAVLEWPPT
jgi:prepilin signal peptidase PulO-like enzyme (type II secretory pathway)